MKLLALLSAAVAFGASISSALGGPLPFGHGKDVSRAYRLRARVDEPGLQPRQPYEPGEPRV